MIKSRKMRWAGHVVRIGRREVYTGFWCGNLKEGDHFEDPDVDARKMLRWIFGKWEMGYGLDIAGSG